MIKYILALAFFPLVAFSQATLSGYVHDAENGETLIGVTLYDKKSRQGTTTNPYGFFSLTLPQDTLLLRVSYLGYQTIHRIIYPHGSKRIDFNLSPKTETLNEVVVSDESFVVEDEVRSTLVGVFSLKPKETLIIPSVGGEADILKVAQLMPGVSKGAEGTTGMYVRGGTDDQNLVTLDEAVVYNVGHLFGFFSVFNPDAVKDVSVIKGGFPTHYGGRLSAVVDTRMYEGNKEKINVKGGVGLLTSRVMVDGPIIPEKASFMVAVRRTYIDKVFNLVRVSLPYFFYDLNAKVNFRISDRDRLYFSTYLGKDVLDVQEEVDEEDEFTNELTFGFDLGNFTTALRWNHLYPNDKLFVNFTLLQTRFKYNIDGDFVDNSLRITSQIQDVAFKAGWDYYLSPHRRMEFGFQSTAHFFRPNVINTSGDISEFLLSQKGSLINTMEYAIYAGSDHHLSDRLRAYYGMRLSTASVEDAFYGGIEPRVNLNYSLATLTSFKVSYSLMRQYMHRVSSSSVILPTDLWYPATDGVKPQVSHQWSAGIFHGIDNWQVNVSLEGFYKTMDKLIEYKEGARLLLNDNFEEELIDGKGRSYGLEFLIRKRSGPFSGWIGYTLSKSDREFDGLNGGNAYPARYDRRHDLSFVGMLDLSERVSLSWVWVYSSGARFTAQTGQYLMPNASLTAIELIPIYSDRNAVELSPSHRLDLNFIIRSRPKRRFTSEWQMGLYNFYNQATPYRVSVEFNGKTFQYVQPGFFGFIPSISYNFSF